MTFLLTHWWTLTGLGIAAVLVVASINGLSKLGGDEVLPSIGDRRQPSPGHGAPSQASVAADNFGDEAA